MGTFRSYVSGPKFAHLKNFLMEVSCEFGLTYTTLEHDKGWIRETIYYKLEGDDTKLRLAQSSIEETLSKYNK